MGYGSAQGLGVFLEQSGHDSYCNFKREAFGRGEKLGLGMFVDRAGQDRYISNRNALAHPRLMGRVGFSICRVRRVRGPRRGGVCLRAGPESQYLSPGCSSHHGGVRGLGGELELSDTLQAFDPTQPFSPVRGRGSILGGVWLGPG